MKTWRRYLNLNLALKALITLQILAGLFLILFSDIGRGLNLFGVAALIYIGNKILAQLANMRELLTYSLFKTNQEDAFHRDTDLPPATIPQRPAEVTARAGQSASAHSDGLRRST